MATISNTPRPGYAWDATDNCWYPIGTGPHTHADYITSSSAINPTIVDAKGDIIAASAADTPARLAVGNNGDTLVANSSAATGLSYTAGNPIPNPIINSCFDIWQRGTTFTIGTNTYGPDRWLAFRGAYAAGSTMSRQLVNDSTNLPNIQYCTRIQRDSGNTSTQGLNFQYWQETANSVILAGKTVTLSFYARAGANYSTASNTLTFQLYTGTGTDQNGATVSYTGAVAAINTTATLTTTWQRFSATVTLATNTNEYGVAFSNTPVGTAGANDYYEVTGVQIDQGSVALPVRRNAATIQGELAACQRYYFRTDSPNAYGCHSTTAFMLSSTAVYSITRLPVNLRTNPSSLDFASIAFFNVADTKFALTSPTLNSAQSNTTHGIFSATITGGTANNIGRILSDNTTAGYIGFSAEL